MRKKTKRINNHMVLYALLLFCATMFMNFGYAAVNGVLVEIDGQAAAISLDSLYISNVIYDSSNGADVAHSVINDYMETTLNSSITLGSDVSSTITYEITVYNTTADNYVFSGTSYSAPNFYDNSNITFDLTDLAVGDVIGANTTKTFYITFRYVGSNVSNPVLNSYISFDFEKYYTITYQHINTGNQNYPTTILDSENTKIITFSNDVPYDVLITPSVNYTYTNGVLTLNDVNTDIVIDRYYSISYVTAGVNPSGQPTKYLHGATVNFLTPTNGSNTFDGWFDNSSYTGNAITSTAGLTGNLTLYAKWSASSSQVATTYITSLVGNASSSSTDVITVASDNPNCTNTFAYDGTTHNNLRYVGASPCNYVKFNCNGTNCELWRIIGVMNGVDTGPVLKIVKDSNSSSGIAWDSNKKNTWTNSSLYNYLNTTYLNSLNSGVINDYVLNAKWFIGGIDITKNVATVYSAETSSQSTNSYIGIYSITDYHYATAGVSGTTRSDCLAATLNSGTLSSCKDGSYLFQSSSYQQWTISKRYNGNNQAIYISNSGRGTNATTQSSYYYKPTVYLKGNVLISPSSGDGSSTRPYELLPGT